MGANVPEVIPMDFGPHIAASGSFSQPEFSHFTPQPGHSSEFGMDFLSTNACTGGQDGSYMASAVTTFPHQGREASFPDNEGHFGSGLASNLDIFACPAPIADDVSLFDAAGTHATYPRSISQEIPDYSAEWISQGSGQGSIGVSTGEMLPGSHPMSLATSSQFGSSMSSSQPSHLDTPLSMNVDDNWSLNNATNGEGVHLGIPDNVYLPLTDYQVDQRFDNFSLQTSYLLIGETVL